MSPYLKKIQDMFDDSGKECSVGKEVRWTLAVLLRLAPHSVLK